MTAGLGVLRLSPRAFWGLTLPELEAALRGALGPAPGTDHPSRSALAQLLHRYPDTPRGDP